MNRSFKLLKLKPSKAPLKLDQSKSIDEWVSDMKRDHGLKESVSARQVSELLVDHQYFYKPTFAMGYQAIHEYVQMGYFITSIRHIPRMGQDLVVSRIKPRGITKLTDIALIIPCLTNASDSIQGGHRIQSRATGIETITDFAPYVIVLFIPCCIFFLTNAAEQVYSLAVALIGGNGLTKPVNSSVNSAKLNALFLCALKTSMVIRAGISSEVADTCYSVLGRPARITTRLLTKKRVVIAKLLLAGAI